MFLGKSLAIIMLKPDAIGGNHSLDPKIKFLNSAFLFAGIVAFGMSFYRWQFSAVMGSIDFVFSLSCLALVYYLNHHKEQVAAISTIALMLTYGLFTAIYLLAPYNTTRIEMFFLLSASAFFLKGRQAGLAWLILILLTIIVGHFLPGFNTAYSHFDIVAACLSLLGLYFIFINYEIFKEKVNEHDRDKEVLRLSEERFRTMIESGSDIICIVSETGMVLFISPSIESVLGFSPEAIINKNLNVLIDSDEQGTFAASLVNILAHPGGEALEQYEFHVKHKDGSYRDIEMIGHNQISNPVIGGIVLNGRDITERKRAEILRSAQNQVLEMIVAGTPLSETLTALVRIIEVQAPGMLGSILLLDVDGVHVRHGAAPSLPAEFIAAIDGQPIGPCVGSCGTAAYRKEAVFVEDIATDPLWADYKTAALPYGLHACWSTPIFDAQRSVLGTFAMYYRQPALPKPDHLQLIDTATHIAALAISHHRNDEALRESEEKFRMISESAQDAIIMMGTDERISAWNTAAERIFGYSAAEAIGQELLQLIAPPGANHTFEQGFQPFLKSGAMPMIGNVIELIALRKGGNAFPVEVSLASLQIGVQRYAMGIFRDITERKRAEEQINNLAFYDPLTRLPNRRLLMDRLHQALISSARVGREGALLFIDLDNFKNINDTLGHDIGDLLLQQVAQRLTSCVRDDDTVSRLGGDEFVVVLENLKAKLAV